MGLRNLTFPTVEVETSGGRLPVRGLSLDHILSLVHRHMDEVTLWFDQLASKAKAGIETTPDDVTVIAVQLLDAAPGIAAEIIALASGSDISDPEGFAGDVGIARALSIAEQFDALEKIGGQTFTSEMPPGKLVALVLQLVQAGASAATPQP